MGCVLLRLKTAALVAGALVLTPLAGCGFIGGGGSGESPSPSEATSQASPGSPLAEFYNQSVRWSGCGGKFDCTKLRVPLDYADPSGDTMQLAVVRLRASDPQGSLVLNPGGPGASGVDYTRSARALLTGQVLKHFDVVGFDPRGVAESDPVDCLTDKQVDQLLAADSTPDTPAEQAELVAISKAVGKGCKKRSPKIAANMGTEYAARDMDILRSVLGDEKLNFLGKSYGSYLGAQYAELFPDRVGRIVLDGVLPSSLNSDDIDGGQAKAFDVALRRFVADCLPRKGCPLLVDSVDAGVVRIQEFLQQADAQPLPGIGSRRVNEALATYAIASLLYFPSFGDWDTLREGLRAAFSGDGSMLLDVVDQRVMRNPDGTYADNGNEAFYAVDCLDRPGLGGADHAAKLAADWAKDAPVFGPYLAWAALPCWQWPVQGDSSSKLKAFAARGSGPILVVSTKYDPATPYEWGVQVSRELANAALLTYDADGHTAYYMGSKCIDNVVDGYLLNGTMPTSGVVCQPDAQ